MAGLENSIPHKNTMLCHAMTCTRHYLYLDHMSNVQLCETKNRSPLPVPGVIYTWLRFQLCETKPVAITCTWSYLYLGQVSTLQTYNPGPGPLGARYRFWRCRCTTPQGSILGADSCRHRARKNLWQPAKSSWQAGCLRTNSVLNCLPKDSSSL